MKEIETTEVEDIESQLSVQLSVLNKAEALKAMVELPIYKELVEELYLKAYRETSAYNIAIMNEEQKQGYMYQITARSIFERFIDGVIIDGVEALTAVQSLKLELDDAKRVAESAVE